MKQKLLFAVAAVVLLVLFAAGALIYSKQKASQAEEAAQRHKDILVRADAPHFGNPQAKVHIVEFFDPACETCKAFYPFVKDMMAANPDRIQLTMRYAPFHNNSDQVVKILEAARKQGKYQPALEAVLAGQAYWAPNHSPQPGLVWPHLEGLGLNMEQMRKDIESPEIARMIQRDLADVQALGVKATPEFFVNGKPMPSFGYDQLRDLVQEALKEGYGD